MQLTCRRRDVGKVADTEGDRRRIEGILLEARGGAVLTVKDDAVAQAQLMDLLRTDAHHLLRDIDARDLLDGGHRLHE